MKVKLRLFALARQLLDQEFVELELREGATVADLRGALAAAHPALAPLLRSSMFAANMQYLGHQSPLEEGQELALIPPVSGG